MSYINQDIKEELVEIDIVHESNWEQKLLLNNGALLKEEPEDGADTVSWGNVYDTYFDVVKKELCSNGSSIEHLSDHHETTPAAKSDLRLEYASAGQSMFTHIKRESPQDEASWSTDCAQTLNSTMEISPNPEESSNAVQVDVHHQHCSQISASVATTSHVCVNETQATSDVSPIHPGYPKTAAERMREYRARKKKESLTVNHQKQKKSAAERAKEYRIRKKMKIHSGDASFTNEPTNNVVKNEPVTLEICFDPKPQETLFKTEDTNGGSPHKTACLYLTAHTSNIHRHIADNSGEKTYACKNCSFKCSRARDLKKHVMFHTGQKPYACKFCDYKCSLSAHLKIHMISHTGEVPYVCKYCDYKSSDVSNFKSHMLTHDGDKPYACKDCDYKCSTVTRLRIHGMRHSGEKPFACNLCKFKSAVAGDLKRHEMRHTRHKPYVCNNCGYKTSRPGILKTHMMKHT